MTSASLAATLRLRPLWFGCAGSALIGWGACNDEFAFGPVGWPNAGVKALGRLAPEPFDKLLIVVGACLLVWAWWSLRPRQAHPHIAAVLTLWSAPLLLVPPVLSGDAVLYADLGWIMSRGLNPYVTGLTTAGGPFASLVDTLWAGQGVAYPPFTLLTDQLLVTAAGAHPYWSVVAMRIPALVAMAILAWVVPRLAARLGVSSARALWLGVFNPMLIVHFVGGAHNDALMVALSVVAVYVAVSGRTWMASLLIGPVVVGVAMLVKQQAGLTVLAVAGLPVAASLLRLTLAKRLWLLGWRSAVAAAVAVATFVTGSLVTRLGFGWTAWLNQMGTAGTIAPFSMLSGAGSWFIRTAGGDPTGYLRIVGLASTLTLLATLVWIVLHFADRPLHAVAWGAFAVAALGQALHPWYTLWPFALFGLVRLTGRQEKYLTVFLSAFLIWNSIQTVFWHTMR